VNSRLDEVQAAILRVKLQHLDRQNDRRRQIAAAYDKALSGSRLLTPPVRRAGAHHVFHLYVLRHPRRDELMMSLKAHGIGTGIHYPMPVHTQPAYQGRVALGPANCAETARAAQEVFSVPMYPELGDEAVARVCDALASL
jgi:dTDP-4-amino-4,6-dideoxygalactose transaminase